MSSLDRAQIDNAIEKLHGAPQMCYVACTGAGAGVTELLWSVAGCSRTLVGSEFPYDPRAVAHLIGRVPNQYASIDAAIGLAAAGYLKGQRCLAEQGKLATPLVSLGLAAAVATDRERKGQDKVYLAVRTAWKIATVEAAFERGSLTRAKEGEICDLLGINCLLWAAGLEQVPIPQSHLTSPQVTAAGTVLPKAVTLSLDAALPIVVGADGSVAEFSALSPSTHIIFPGSFNPLHYGHDLIAQTVAAMTGKQVVFEISAANADKDGIVTEALAARALQFLGRWPAVLSENLPLFIQKARAYGGYGFIIGLDTALRLLDQKYYSSEEGRDGMLADLRQIGAIFYAVNRGDDPQALATFLEDPRVRGLFVPVPLLVPISSSDLRAAQEKPA